jgi:hypothetical protein
MKCYQLQFSNGIIFNKIFKTNSKTNIKDYVLLNFYEFTPYLKLNEDYNVSVNISHDKNTIIVSGDEDYKEISILDVEFVEV